MMHVVPVWTVEYKSNQSEPLKSYRVNADSLFEVLQHFMKFNHGLPEPKWLRVTMEEAPSQSGYHATVSRSEAGGSTQSG